MSYAEQIYIDYDFNTFESMDYVLKKVYVLVLSVVFEILTETIINQDDIKNFPGFVSESLSVKWFVE